jgi:uncharacterized protein (DUF427 family)
VEPSGFDLRPDYRVDILARRNRVAVTVAGEVVAETVRSLLVDEQDHGLVFYFPPDDVRLERFVPDDRTTRCPYKGTATYRRYDGEGLDVSIWCYEQPHLEVARIAGYWAFFQDAVDLRVGEAVPAVSGR